MAGTGVAMGAPPDDASVVPQMAAPAGAVDVAAGAGHQRGTGQPRSAVLSGGVRSPVAGVCPCRRRPRFAQHRPAFHARPHGRRVPESEHQRAARAVGLPATPRCPPVATHPPSRATAMKPRASLRRVVYVVSQFPCLSETFIVREVKALIDEGVDVRIVSLKPPAAGPVQPEAKALLDRVRHPQDPARALTGIAAAALLSPLQLLGAMAMVLADSWRRPEEAGKSLGALFRGLQHTQWLRRFDPQLIHAHWATYPTTVAWTLARVTQRPVYFTSHAHDISVQPQLLPHKLRDAALAVTISRFNVEWLRRFGGAKAGNKLRVVHCGVDLERSTWQSRDRVPGLILAVGRLDPIKGFDTLIEALALLQERGIR